MTSVPCRPDTRAGGCTGRCDGNLQPRSTIPHGDGAARAPSTCRSRRGTGDLAELYARSAPRSPTTLGRELSVPGGHSSILDGPGQTATVFTLATGNACFFREVGVAAVRAVV